jgi:hypothetical protein
LSELPGSCDFLYNSARTAQNVAHRCLANPQLQPESPPASWCRSNEHQPGAKLLCRNLLRKISFVSLVCFAFFAVPWPSGFGMALIVDLTKEQNDI